MPLRLVDASSDVASSRRKTSDWTLIPVKIFFRRGCAALAQLFHFLQSAKAAGRDDHPVADKISSARPEPSIAWKSIRCRCRICSSGSSSPTAEAARPPSISMQRCGAPISGGVHDEVGRRRSPLIQPGADPHRQRRCCCLRSGSSVHHYWHSGRGWHRRKHCRAGRLLARLRSCRRRRSRRRPAQAHPVCRAAAPSSLSTASACCTFHRQEAKAAAAHGVGPGAAPIRGVHHRLHMGPHAPSCSPCAALTNQASSSQNPAKIVNFDAEIVQKRWAVTAVTAAGRTRAASTLGETGKSFLQNDRFFRHFDAIFFYCCNALYCSSSSRWYHSLFEMLFRSATLAGQSAMAL